MPWLKLDCRFHDHPKVVGLSDAAYRLHIGALLYAKEHLTDGVITTETAQRVWNNPVSALEPRISELVGAGLWKISGKPPGSKSVHWVIHNFLKWNLSKEQVNKSKGLHRVRVAK